ncbi:ninjurin-2 isoform X4 [Lepeophtheirus salmonis]|uniref:ninjurin-2 isoform X4 n=1 Tax=Lepeophtheirus salmonis TaxID=72036 RepID=UPI001AE2509B|nr:ninjurin-2-like isoform X2 [Lepeophtheirus salmonis]
MNQPLSDGKKQINTNNLYQNQDPFYISGVNFGSPDDLYVYYEEPPLKVHQSTKMSVSEIGRGPSYNKPLDANRYATKKTIAQGMLDIALLTANASQLKYVLQVGEENHPFYYLMISLISISIILQGIVGVLFLIIGGLNINKKTEHKAADRLNNVIILIIFFITLINVVLNGFGIRTTDLKK